MQKRKFDFLNGLMWFPPLIIERKSNTELLGLLSITEEIEKETGNCNVNVRKLDLSILDSIRNFARQINEEENRLDVLIHNAGIAQFVRNKVSEDNLEITMVTNHYGPFLLTHLLIGKRIYIYLKI